MEIYIGNLPSQTDSTELKKVVSTVLLPHSFRELLRKVMDRNYRLIFGEIDVFENQRGDLTTRYAHAVIMPDQVAREVLRRMDHLTYQGKSLRVREYAVRDHANDRRQRNSHSLYTVKSCNRRTGDRRLLLNQ